MICHHCKESIEGGEACIPEMVEGSTHYHFFHANCYVAWKEEDNESEINKKVNLARMVH